MLPSDATEEALEGALACTSQPKPDSNSAEPTSPVEGSKATADKWHALFQQGKIKKAAMAASLTPSKLTNQVHTPTSKVNIFLSLT